MSDGIELRPRLGALVLNEEELAAQTINVNNGSLGSMLTGQPAGQLPQVFGELTRGDVAPDVLARGGTTADGLTSADGRTDVLPRDEASGRVREDGMTDALNSREAAYGHAREGGNTHALTREEAYAPPREDGTTHELNRNEAYVPTLDDVNGPTRGESRVDALNRQSYTVDPDTLGPTLRDQHPAGAPVTDVLAEQARDPRTGWLGPVSPHQRHEDYRAAVGDVLGRDPHGPIEDASVSTEDRLMGDRMKVEQLTSLVREDENMRLADQARDGYNGRLDGQVRDGYDGRLREGYDGQPNDQVRDGDEGRLRDGLRDGYDGRLDRAPVRDVLGGDPHGPIEDSPAEQVRAAYHDRPADRPFNMPAEPVPADETHDVHDGLRAEYAPDVPLEPVPAEPVPAEYAPDVPLEPVPAEDVPTEDVTAEDVTAEDAPTHGRKRRRGSPNN